MAVDRYVKTVLTIIALELFWIGVKDLGTPVTAQASLTPQRRLRIDPRSSPRRHTGGHQRDNRH